MSQQANPEMLILGRESRGLVQKQVADATGISQANISKYESGLLSVSQDHAQHIATALDYPIAFFFQSGQRYGFGSSCTYHRKRQTMPVQELKKILANINIRRLELSRFLNNVDIEFDNEFPRLDLEDYNEDPGEVARVIRGFWHLPLGPITNLTNVIEGAGGIIHPCDFGTRKLDAVSQLVAGTPPLFFANSETPTDRMRYTLAHELGHIIMHHIPNTDTHEQERQADQFAAEFLMPAKEIRSHLDNVTLPILARLKSFWKVSMAALARRAYDLGKLTDWQYRQIYQQLSNNNMRLNEPVILPVEKPTVLENIIQVHLNENGYSISEMSQLAGLHESEFLREYPLALQGGQGPLQPPQTRLRMVG